MCLFLYQWSQKMYFKDFIVSYGCMYVFVHFPIYIQGRKRFMKAKMLRNKESYDVALVVGKTPKTILKTCSKVPFIWSPYHSLSFSLSTLISTHLHSMVNHSVSEIGMSFLFRSFCYHSPLVA